MIHSELQFSSCFKKMENIITSFFKNRCLKTNGIIAYEGNVVVDVLNSCQK